MHTNVHTFQRGRGFGFSPTCVARIETQHCSSEKLAAQAPLRRILSPMSDATDRLNAALEGRYAIERELGEGGMARKVRGIYDPRALNRWGLPVPPP